MMAYQARISPARGRRLSGRMMASRVRIGCRSCLSSRWGLSVRCWWTFSCRASARRLNRVAKRWSRDLSDMGLMAYLLATWGGFCGTGAWKCKSSELSALAGRCWSIGVELGDGSGNAKRGHLGRAAWLGAGVYQSGLLRIRRRGYSSAPSIRRYSAYSSLCNHARRSCS